MNLITRTNLRTARADRSGDGRAAISRASRLAGRRNSVDEGGVGMDRNTVTRAGNRGSRGALIESRLANRSKIHINQLEKNIREEIPGRQESQREEGEDREKRC